jgi:hypothetical protein
VESNAAPTTTTADVLMAILQESSKGHEDILDDHPPHIHSPFYVNALVLLFVSKLTSRHKRAVTLKVAARAAALVRRPNAAKHKAFKRFFFNVFDLEVGLSCALVVRALTEIGAGLLSVPRLNAFVLALHAGYHPEVAYHNWDHALCVFQVSWLVFIGLVLG